MDIKAVIKMHLDRYPLMEVRDGVKLLYQRCFAGGHMISDLSACLERAEVEMADAAPEFISPDALGNGLARLHLSSARAAGLSAESVGRAFAATANSFSPQREQFLEELDALAEFFPDGDEFVEKYKASGCPALHHSEGFAEKYRPAYRVVRQAHCLMVKAAAAIEKLPGDKVLIAVDGPCGGGKSTLSEALGEMLDANVFHCDDFFLRPEQRTPSRYETPGGNVDHERILEEIILPLRRGETPCPRKFDCSTMTLTEGGEYPEKRINILEGSYSLHPMLREHIDLALWTDVSPETQLRRLSLRTGDTDAFVRKWIPLENTYFAAFSVKESADLIISNEEDFI